MVRLASWLVYLFYIEIIYLYKTKRNLVSLFRNYVTYFFLYLKKILNETLLRFSNINSIIVFALKFFFVKLC